MSFADDLRQKAQDEILKEEQKKQAKLDAIKKEEDLKKAFFATRHEAILSGEAVASFYENFKQELMEVASWCISDDSKHRCGTFVYLPEELAQKEAYYNDALEKKEDYYCELICSAGQEDTFSGKEGTWARRSLRPLYYDTIIPHKVFDEEECNIIEKQLEDIFSKNGLRCSLKRQKVYQTIHEEIELGRWRKTCDDFCGYTLGFDAKWHPWDTSKPISAECLEKIRLECFAYENSSSYLRTRREKGQKLLEILGLDNEAVYFLKDTTLFNSGKEGFAITEEGIYEVTKGQVHKKTYQALADEIVIRDSDCEPDIEDRIREIVRADLS